MRPHKKKGGSEASSLVPMVSLAQELVANRARNARRVRNCRARSRCYADGGSTWGDKLNQPSLVRAEGTHAGRLHSGWSGIHFESVEYAANQKSTRSVEHIAALRIRGDAPEGVD